LETEENQKIIQELNLQIVQDIVLDDGLMERYFGRLDGDYLFTYAYVWPVDMFDSTQKGFDVESVAEVSKRTGDAMLRIDSDVVNRGKELNGRSEGSRDIVVITSHADTLQILQVYAAGLPNVGMFSSYRFENGEVREMQRTLSSLPAPVPLQVPQKGT